MTKINYPEAIKWVLNQGPYSETDIEYITLTQKPDLTTFLEFCLDLDYEIYGGTWDNPLWAWKKHPWYKELSINDEDVYDYFKAMEG